MKTRTLPGKEPLPGRAGLMLGCGGAEGEGGGFYEPERWGNGPAE